MREGNFSFMLMRQILGCQQSHGVYENKYFDNAARCFKHEIKLGQHPIETGATAIMTEPLTALNSRCINAEHTAIFLDFDGTLVEFAERPDLVQLSPVTKSTLGQIHEALGGALAVITGRDIEDVDRFLKPLHLPVAGVHGLIRRRTDGSVHSPPVDGRAIYEINARLQQFVSSSQGLLLELKSGSVALHYRARPDLENECTEAMDNAVYGLESIHLIRGKMVIEAKADTSDKGGAIRDFLSEPPFAGRMPFFAGDDVTDEDAFVVVNSRQGISVKVGPGQTLARYRANSTPEFLDWLQCVGDDLEQAQTVEQS
jgi:trehalose 6-phosphate phosphatase